jgi:hypothetical protein
MYEQRKCLRKLSSAALACGLLMVSMSAKSEFYCRGLVRQLNAHYNGEVRLSLAGPNTISPGVYEYGANSATDFNVASVCSLNATVTGGDGLPITPATCKAMYQTLLAAKLAGLEVRFGFVAATTPTGSCLSTNFPTFGPLYGAKGLYYGPEM